MSDTPTPEPTTPTTDATSPSGDNIGELPADQAVFDRGYVEEVRGEAQRYREEARAAQEQLAGYEKVYGAYEPEDRAVWLDIATTWASDPRQAATIMQQIAQAVLGENNQPVDEEVIDELEADSPLTQEQVAELVREQIETAEYERQQDAMVETIYASMRKAGIEPRSRDGIAVLWTANNETDGDIDKAIEMFEADRRKAVDQYVADRAAGKRPTPAPANGVPASAHAPVTNLEDARKAADAYIRAQVGQ